MDILYYSTSISSPFYWYSGSHRVKIWSFEWL